MAEKKGFKKRLGGYVGKRVLVPGTGRSKAFLNDAKGSFLGLKPIKRKDVAYIWNGPSEEEGRKIFAAASGNTTEAQRNEAIGGINRAMMIFAGFTLVVFAAWIFGVMSGLLGALATVAVMLMTGLLLTILNHQKNQIREKRIMGLKESIFGK